MHPNSNVPINSVAINMQMVPDRETIELIRNSYNNFTQKRYKEMITRRHILGHLNRWNKIVSIILYGSGAIIAFLAGALNSWILSIISGSISTLGGVCDLIGKISEEMCVELDKKLKEPEKYYFRNENQENRDNINSQRLIVNSIPETPSHLTNYDNQVPLPPPASPSYFIYSPSPYVYEPSNLSTLQGNRIEQHHSPQLHQW